MPASVKLKVALGVFLSFFFTVVDFWFKSDVFTFHMGPFIVGVVFVSAITEAYKKK